MLCLFRHPRVFRLFIDVICSLSTGWQAAGPHTSQAGQRMAKAWRTSASDIRGGGEHDAQMLGSSIGVGNLHERTDACG